MSLLHSSHGAALRQLKASAAFALVVGLCCAALAADFLVERQGLSSPVLWQSLAVYLGVAAAVRLGLPAHLPQRQFGPANVVTLLRAVLVCLLAGLLGHASPSALGWLLPFLALVVLILDGLDGFLARRRDCASVFGARFDQEVDGLFVLVLASLVWLDGQAGAWVLVSGLWHYVFHLARLSSPSLRRPLPHRWRRKTVFVLQVLLLIAALTPPFNGWPGALAAALGVLLLSGSFLVDLFWLIHTRALTLERNGTA
ncbi:CDP-alcohol phosphatidyltransferase family protein [Algihabitans albus]|uniref:CDP-alcohol phosphatidyltransferase family protein n=1 Tax=Algihabitans albus TaxID=2164067 RepID=UPI000E5CAB0B|nr:CDP-alcohol phosphatidyltransferase family protein [Algihabitans albus]